MERKLTIAVDLDSTLNSLNHVWITKYNEIYRKERKPHRSFWVI